MHHTRGRVVDVTTLADFDRRLAAGARSLAGWRVTGARPARPRPRAGVGRDVAQSLLQGCTFAPGDEESVRRRGAVVLPRVPDAPRRHLPQHALLPRAISTTPPCTPTRSTPAPTRGRGRPPDQDDALAQALHDHSIDQALADVDAGPVDRRGDGRARAAARVRRRTPTRPGSGRALGRPADRRDRRRAGRDGGGQPGGRSCRPDRVGARLGAGGARRRAVLHARHRRLGGRRVRRASTPSPPASSRSASRPGTTATSRPTRSRRRSRSTSATPPGRRSCSRCATPGSSSSPAPAAPCRRSSRTPARTTTPTSRRSHRWCSSGVEHWTETLPAWPLLRVPRPRRAMEDARAPRRHGRRGRPRWSRDVRVTPGARARRAGQRCGCRSRRGSARPAAR